MYRWLYTGNPSPICNGRTTWKSSCCAMICVLVKLWDVR